MLSTSSTSRKLDLTEVSTNNEASSKLSYDSDDKDAPSKKGGLIATFRKALADTNFSLQLLKKFAKPWKSFQPLIVDMLNTLKEKLESTDDIIFDEEEDTSISKNSPWKDFIQEFLNCIPKVSAFFDATSKIDKLNRYSELMAHAPNLVVAFSRLNLASIIGGDIKPDSVAQLQKKLIHLIESQLGEKYLINLSNSIDSQFTELENYSIEKFNSNSKMKQDIILATMDKFNQTLKKTILRLDKTEIALSRGEGALMNMPCPQLEFDLHVVNNAADIDLSKIFCNAIFLIGTDNPRTAYYVKRNKLLHKNELPLTQEIKLTDDELILLNNNKADKVEKNSESKALIANLIERIKAPQISQLNNRSLAQISKLFTAQYKEYRQAAGYPCSPDMFYPYESSLLQQRKQMLEDFLIRIHLEEKNIREEEPLKARVNAINLIDDRINELEIKLKAKTIKSGVKSKIACLKKLKDQININNNLELAVNSLPNPKLIQSGKTAIMYKELISIYAEADKSIKYKVNGLYNQLEIRKKRVRSAIKLRAEQDVADQLAQTTITEIIQRTASFQIKESKDSVSTPESKQNIVMPHDFEHELLHTVLPKNIQHIQDLMKLFSSDGSSNSDNHFLQIAEKIVLQCDLQFKKLLEDDIYATYILKNENPIVPNEYQPWIQQFGLCFQEAQAATIELRRYQTSLNKENSELEVAVTPIENLVKAGKNSEQMLTALTRCIQALQNLKKNPFVRHFIQQFSSLDNVKNLAEETFTMSNESLTKDPLYNLVIDKNNLQQIRAVNGRLEKIHLGLNKISNQFGQDKDSNQIIVKLTDDFGNLIPKLYDFQKRDIKSRTKWEIFEFISSHRKIILALLKKLPHASQAIQKISNEEFQFIMREVNLVFRDFTLLLENLEIQLFCKPGSLLNLPLRDKSSENTVTSLREFMEKFNSELAAQGYTFSDEERYPYLSSIANQRQAMRAAIQNRNLPTIIENLNKKIIKQHNLPNQLNSLQKQKDYLSQELCNTNITLTILNTRIAQSHDAMQQYRDRLTHEDIEKYTPIHQHICTLIDIRINSLELELTKRSNTTSKNIKINLLKELKPALADLKNSADDIINKKMATNPNLHLLFNGRSQATLRNFKKITLSRKALLQHIELKIHDLEHELKNKFFFFNSSKKQLIDTIQAYGKFKAFLAKSGYDVINAKNNLRAQYPALYQTFYQHEQSFLFNLQSIYSASHLLRIEKKVICENLDKPALPLLSLPFMLQLIDQRVTELSSSCWLFKTRTKKIKVELLELLKNHLTTLPFNQALEKIRSESENYYLLLEGKTGNLLKKLEYSSLKLPDMLARLDTEIFRLQQQRTETCYFFRAAARINANEKCIQALLQLKANIAALNGNNINLQSAWQQLSDEQRLILTDREMPLWNELMYWQSTRESAAKQSRRRF